MRSKFAKKKPKKSNYIQDVVEWQEHQFTKGYYTGGEDATAHPLLW
jgi:hypothetical protein